MTKHFNIRIRGDVQGVFFRVSARDKAEALGIRGFARNEMDGSLYIEVEGDEEALKKFLAWVRSGPTLANVEEIKMAEGTVQKFNNFTIAY